MRILSGLMLERARLDTEKSLLGLSEEWFTKVERGTNDNRILQSRNTGTKRLRNKEYEKKGVFFPGVEGNQVLCLLKRESCSGSATNTDLAGNRCRV